MAEKKVEDKERVAIQNWEPVNENGQPKSPDEIEQDIEETRNDMDTLLDAL